jgi:hypothetical protein
LEHVPTAHPRIALTRDPELDEALKRGASLLGDKPTATIARELILRGAQDLVANSGPALDRWLSELGATPAPRSTGDVLVTASNLGPPDPDNPHPLSDALAELREEQL